MSEILELYQNKRKVAFCAAARRLPPEVRQVIWSKQGKGGGVYGNTKPIGLEDLIEAILEEKDMYGDTFEEKVDENSYQGCNLSYIFGLYDLFSSKFPSRNLLAYLNGVCFQDIDEFPDAGLDFAKYAQPRQYKRYCELDDMSDISDDGLDEMKQLEEGFRYDYENDLFGHTSTMGDDWKLGSGTNADIVHLALEVLGIDRENAREVRRIFRSQFLAAYEIAVSIWMQYMFDLIKDDL